MTQQRPTMSIRLLGYYDDLSGLIDDVGKVFAFAASFFTGGPSPPPDATLNTINSQLQSISAQLGSLIQLQQVQQAYTDAHMHASTNRCARLSVNCAYVCDCVHMSGCVQWKTRTPVSWFSVTAQFACAHHHSQDAGQWLRGCQQGPVVLLLPSGCLPCSHA